MVFYTFIASLRRKIREEVQNTTPTHKFIRALRDSGRLVRCYTQNIDGLEAREGLCLDLKRGKGSRSRFMKNVVNKPRPEGPTIPGSETDGGCEVVQLHGDLEALRCGLCNELCSWEDEDRETVLLSGKAPKCHSCVSKNENRRFSGKRGTAVGGLRPNVVLYGEEHPSADLLSPITTHDLKLGPDVLVILGTSLRVHGLKIMVREFAKAVHARGGGKVILVNRTRPAESAWSKVIDYWVGMDCDEWVADLRQRRGDIWERQGALRLPVVKEVKSKVVKSKKEKTTRKALVVIERKNITIKKRETAAKAATVAKKRSAKKVVDARPAQKATKGRADGPKTIRLRLPVHRISTPSTDGSDVTPPVYTSKRRILNLHEDALASPSKRKKGNAQARVDGAQSAPRRDETLFVEVPFRRKERTTTERPQSAARTSMRRVV
jgi:NAD-dependent SIR2 family protein deacetylase